MKPAIAGVGEPMFEGHRWNMGGMRAAVLAVCLCGGAAILAIPASGQDHPGQTGAPSDQQAMPPAAAHGGQKKRDGLGKRKPIHKSPVKHGPASQKKAGAKAAKKSAGTTKHAETTMGHAKKKEAVGEMPTVVVRHGGAKDPKLEIAPVESRQQQAQTSRNTSELLASTDQNLKKITGWKLSSQQQDMVGQIQNYVSQAVAARKSGDLERAQSFASKAKQLSDEMVKP